MNNTDRVIADYAGMFFLILFILFTVGAITLGCLQPYFESRAYNRLTGAHTTYWDAVWLELRVQEQPKSR